ncbi:hypothetical protein [Clavibacter zhangzhiyongii]|uniref:hypothetical protein n=1 Tax=Clavibacter zhangzhiyongii TaxID=2768071 RepID=UPI0039DFE97B
MPRRPDEAELGPIEQAFADVARDRDRRRFLREKQDRTPEEDAELVQALAGREAARQRRLQARDEVPDA